MTVMKTRRFFGNLLPLVICGLTLMVSVAFAEETAKKMPPKVTYEDDVLPIFRQKCFSCHDADKKKGDLDLTNYSSLMQGGGSGEVVEAGDSANSYLYMVISHETEPYMPPEQPKLPDEMVETIRKWIDGGVLESKSSKARLKKRATFDLALQSAPTERPAVAPMPPRLSLEPLTRTTTTTAVSAMATSPWSPLAAIASQQQVLLYNTQTLQLVGTLPFPEGIPQVLKFSRNGSLLLAGGGQGGASGKCIVWNIHTGERVFEIGDELDTVLAADISSDQTLIALGGPKRVVRIYSTESGQLLHELRKHTDWVCSIEFSPDSVLLATGDRGGGLYVWEGWTGREYLTLKAHSACVTDVSWRSDSNVVASCSEDGSIRLWEMDNGGQIKNWGAHSGGVASIEFTHDGRIFSCGRDRVPRLWDQNGGKKRDFEAFTDLALEVGFCNETNRAIAGDWTGAIRIWNAADGARIGELTSNPPKLAERLAVANQLVTVKSAEHKPLAEAYQAALAALNKAKADLAAAQKVSAESKKRFDAATTKLGVTKEAATKATQAEDAAKKAATKLADVVPVLNEAATKAVEAAKKLADDKELVDIANALKNKSVERATELEANKKDAAAKLKALELAKAALVAAEKELQDSDTAYKASLANVSKLTPLVKPAEEKANATKQAADAADAALTAARDESKRWTDEIAFATQLTALITKRAEARTVLEEREEQQFDLDETAASALAALNKSKAEIDAAQKVAVAAQTTSDALLVEFNKTKEGLTVAEAARTTIASKNATLVAVIAPLNEALTQLKVATDKIGKDKELTDISATLQKLADAKKTALEAGKNDLEVKTLAVATAKQQMTDAEKKANEAKAAVVAAQQRTTSLKATMKPLETKANEANVASAAIAKSVGEAEKVVDEVNGQINTAKGIKAA
jgi:hypothetical protein